ncbi:hypothetical protein DITRI_Ditri05aG0092900 [Diplodiscus trichospermus]
MVEGEVRFSSVSSEVMETKKRKRGEEKSAIEKATATRSSKKKEKKRVYNKKVVYDEGEFEVGDDVYVKRREDASSDDENPEMEECRVCFKARKLGKDVEFPKPPEGKKWVRTLREKLLSSYLWAVRIERFDFSFEEIASGRQPHNLKKELHRTNDFAVIETESIIRHCNVMSPEDNAKANNEGILARKLTLIHMKIRNMKRKTQGMHKPYCLQLLNWLQCVHALSSQKGSFFGLQKIGAKKIREHVRCHKQTELERAKATLLLAKLPKSLPCRNKNKMSVMAVMRNIKSEVDAGSIIPYCFVEVIYEASTGHRVSWKIALQLLHERFSDGKKIDKEADRPCILLIDELDLLVTRNQLVLYNILDWPTKPYSKLIVIAISGDARCALEICRRVAETADYRIKNQILTVNSSIGKQAFWNY